MGSPQGGAAKVGRKKIIIYQKQIQITDMTNFIGNWFDIAFICIILTLAILAFLRGFIRDFASLLNWLISIGLTYFLSPYIIKLFDKTKYSDIVINSAVSSIMFVIILIVTSMITSKFVRILAEKLPKSVDQSLGFAFGLTKAYFIISLIFTVIIAFYASGIVYADDPIKFKAGKKVGPDWLTESKSYEILEIGGNILKPVTNLIMDSVKEYDHKKIKDSKDQILKKLDQIEENEKIKDLKKHMENEDLSDENITEGKGYDFKEIKKMNRLIEIIDNQQ